LYKFNCSASSKSFSLQGAEIALEVAVVGSTRGRVGCSYSQGGRANLMIWGGWGMLWALANGFRK